ncbi:flagellar motor protein MotB [Paenibacillus albicereus]|uniref:Flagellar motor protein MotB n=1 Tax=Paenibacillus albicereus TaxID=2726185 RepID=A0A6H2GTW0_9BACL|nr:flagellar motor protein MotB [Paenibacillus albicereus]QJC50606.1 flagellar motor protein MotB [Paenibacillus albicereus]
MRRRRNRRGVPGAEPENHERWLITYSDLITLLLIFFVVLYAMSQLDVKKYEVLAQSLQLQFAKSDSVIEGGKGLTGELLASGSTPVPTVGAKPRASETPQQQLKRLQEQELQNLLQIIQTYIREHKLQDKVTVVDTPKGIAIRLNDLFLFDLGHAKLKPEATPVLERLSTLFRSLGNTVSVEGHTDNLPIAPGGQYGDNWELSAARSLSVLHYFIEKSKLDPNKFEIAGYADTRPVTSNATEAGRSKNRRVEITVLRTSTDAGGS